MLIIGVAVPHAAPPRSQHAAAETSRLGFGDAPRAPSSGFLGRLTAQLLQQTEPCGARYCPGGVGEWRTLGEGSSPLLDLPTMRSV